MMIAVVDVLHFRVERKMNACVINIPETKGFKSIKFYLKDNVPTMEWVGADLVTAKKLSQAMESIMLAVNDDLLENSDSQLNLAAKFLFPSNLIFRGNFSQLMMIVKNYDLLDQNSIDAIYNDNIAKGYLEMSSIAKLDINDEQSIKKYNLQDVGKMLTKLKKNNKYVESTRSRKSF